MAHIAKGRFDLLLMDMNYGRDTTSGQEGLELIDAMKKDDPDLQIVVMTAWSTIDLAVASLQHGAADFLQKPWENDIALKMVQRQSALTREQRERASRMLRDNEDALEVQRALMGAAQKDYGRFSIAGATRAAKLVGGDYFDTFPVTESSSHSVSPIRWAKALVRRSQWRTSKRKSEPRACAPAAPLKCAPL